MITNTIKRTQKWIAAVAVLVLLSTSAAAPRAQHARESAFLAANDAVMSRMMKAMTIAPSGDVDRDFVAMMVPHHQGAIDMARIILEHGSDDRLKRIAQEIIVTQQDEIVAMQRISATMPVPSSSGKHVP